MQVTGTGWTNEYAMTKTKTKTMKAGQIGLEAQTRESASKFLMALVQTIELTQEEWVPQRFVFQPKSMSKSQVEQSQ